MEYRPGEDPTLDFHAALNDPSRWVIKKNVPVFKPHERVDPNTKALIKVDPSKLQRIANNLQRMERAGVPVRMTLGHTEPGKPETQQPPVCGYYRNARVQRFGPQQELAVVVDEWLDPQYLNHRKNFPFRSAEYYDDSEQITGVALLTRDPWLDLGVVAYHKAGPGCTFYSRTSEISQPKHYHFLIGDFPMWPETNPQVPPFAAVPGNTQQVPAPQPQPEPTPAQYAGQVPPVPYAGMGGGMGWPSNHHPPGMNRPHPQGRGSAVYANQQYPGQGYYANEPPSLSGGASAGMSGGMSGGMPPGMSGGMSGGMGGGDDDVLVTVHDLLSQAVAALAEALGSGGGGAAPQSPFPPSAPAMNARYAAQQRPQARRYSRDNPPAQMTRTISGLPVGYQLELDKRDAQIRQLNDAMRVLFYEKDQRDTEACVAEIQTLIAQGFHTVGEYELAELKRKNPQERTAYIQHIMAKYERVPSDYPPPVLGDPTPGPTDDPQSRPASQEEVTAALEMSRNDRRPTAYIEALNYIRANGGVNRMSQYGAPGFDQPPGGQFVDNSGGDVPNGYYPEPSSNGHGHN